MAVCICTIWMSSSGETFVRFTMARHIAGKPRGFMPYLGPEGVVALWEERENARVMFSCDRSVPCIEAGVR
jgi:hypothetical protein